MQPDKQRNTQVRAKRAEDAVAHFAEQVRVALADQEGGLAWLRDVKAVSQGSITVKVSMRPPAASLETHTVRRAAS